MTIAIVASSFFVLEASARHVFARLGRLEVCLVVRPQGTAWSVERDAYGTTLQLGRLEVSASLVPRRDTELTADMVR